LLALPRPFTPHRPRCSHPPPLGVSVESTSEHCLKMTAPRECPSSRGWLASAPRGQNLRLVDGPMARFIADHSADLFLEGGRCCCCSSVEKLGGRAGVLGSSVFVQFFSSSLFWRGGSECEGEGAPASQIGLACEGLLPRAFSLSLIPLRLRHSFFFFPSPSPPPSWPAARLHNSERGPQKAKIPRLRRSTFI
jgi:hypothetical protein